MDAEKLEQRVEAEIELESLFQGCPPAEGWRWPPDLEIDSVLPAAVKTLERRSQTVFQIVS